MIDGVPTDVLEGQCPVEMSATVRCRNAKITAARSLADGAVEITSPGHGLFDGDRVRIFGVPLGDGDIVLPIEIVNGNPDVFMLPPGVVLETEPLEDFAFWTEVCAFDDSLCCCCTAGSITDATSTNPVRITSSSHGLQAGDRIKIARIEGMKELLGNEYTVANIKADSFDLQGVDGTFFTMAGSGLERGDWQKVCVSRTGEIQRVRIGEPVMFASQGHSLKPRDRVHILLLSNNDKIYKMSTSGRDEPYTVAAVTGDAFSVEELSDGGSIEEEAVVGCWYRIAPDTRRYSRVRGGIRVAMSKAKAGKRNRLVNMGKMVSVTLSSWEAEVMRAIRILSRMVR